MTQPPAAVPVAQTTPPQAANPAPPATPAPPVAAPAQAQAPAAAQAAVAVQTPAAAQARATPQAAVPTPLPSAGPTPTPPAPAARVAPPAAAAPAKSASSKPAKTAAPAKTVAKSPAKSGTPGKSVLDKLHRQSFREWAHQRLIEAPGYLVSILAHAVALFLLSLMVIDSKQRADLLNTILSINEDQPVNEKLDDTQIVPEKLEKLEQDSVEMPQTVMSEVVAEKPNPVDLNISDEPPQLPSIEPVETGAGPKLPTGDLAGRSQAARAALAASQGGTAASEEAVNSGLKWLARHQRPDGSWSFKIGPDPGTLDGPMGATGMALLAFLGGGHTHMAGDYKKNVDAGLRYLVANMKPNGDMRGNGEGNMYAHGICAIALCEVYALSKDRNLKNYAQASVNFIINAQDPKGGGWRYTPGQPGDTSVVGWQIMALKSAKIAKLQIPNKTIGKATFFLNSVQTNEGANYGYETPGAGPATSAVGLLCRMYLGWNAKNPALEKGVEYLGNIGPQPNNMYFNYYAAQVLHHWGGEPWNKWNTVMRDHLVKTQEQEGDLAGSWPVPKGGGHVTEAGGRLCQTCFCIMTLEVYYRHLPIYQRETIKVEF